MTMLKAKCVETENKLSDICEKNGYTYKLQTNRYPITITFFREAATPSGQLSLCGDSDSVRYDGTLFEMTFEDGSLTISMADDFYIDDAILSKIKCAAKKLQEAHVNLFFETESGRMPTISRTDITPVFKTASGDMCIVHNLPQR